MERAGGSGTHRRGVKSPPAPMNGGGGFGGLGVERTRELASVPAKPDPKACDPKAALPALWPTCTQTPVPGHARYNKATHDQARPESPTQKPGLVMCGFLIT